MHTIDPTTDAQEIERVPAADGELVLRRAGEHYEIISNGCFLMDTRAGASERLLVRTALDALGDGTDLRILVGGLGVGFTLREALTDARVAQVTVIEREPAVVRWGTGPLAPFSGHALADPRVRVVTSDLVAWVHSGAGGPVAVAGAAGGPGGEAGGERGVEAAAEAGGERGVEAAAEAGGGPGAEAAAEEESPERFHALCLDIDNGPDWTVTDGNASLYDDAGLAALRARLLPGGVLTVWSATASPAFAERLRQHFTRVSVHRVPVPRGEPDVVFVAHEL
ncbi:spermidine synthase [Embleya sp. NPDC050493]|uniref:spermidine synthase n=1 Tax=Embleya sp. NPDC050493 TaxID=3363989 RepID=UPI0037AD5B3A